MGIEQFDVIPAGRLDGIPRIVKNGTLFLGIDLLGDVLGDSLSKVFLRELNLIAELYINLQFVYNMLVSESHIITYSYIT